MFWLRNRRILADGRTRIGWITQLRRALIRWLTPRSAIDGDPRAEDPPTRYVNSAARSPSQSSPPVHAQPNGPLSAEKAGADARIDALPPTAEGTGPEPDHKDNDTDRSKPTAQAAPVASETPDEIAPPPCSPFLPDPILREKAPGAATELAESSTEPAAQDCEGDQGPTETAAEAGEAATQCPTRSISPADDPKLQPIEDPPTESTDDPQLAPPTDAEEGTEEASTMQLPNVGSDLDAIQPVQEAEEPRSQAASDPTERDAEKNRDTSRQQSVGKRRRGAPDDPSKIPRYRPRLRPPPEQAPARTAASPESSDTALGTLEAMYLISFLPGGWGLSLSVLLSRVDGMPEHMSIRAGGGTFPLYAIDENLFEPIQPSNENLVAEGFVAESEGYPVRRWVRSARDLHAFSQRPGVAGFASVPRVLIGQENVVICRSAVAETVRQCSSATGSDPLVEVGGPGIPEGWHCFRGYWPRHPADFAGLDEVFLALNPHPDASIQLSGGIASARGTWVLGAPPVVHVLGAVPGPRELTIDGNPATESSEQGWTSPGWDTLGTHTVRFGGLSRTYEIAAIEEDWPSWSTADEASFSVCGARVSAATGVQALAITGGPYWLIGAAAGDLTLARRSSQGVSIAAPSFLPVWAVPPLGSGRRSSAIALAHEIAPRRPAANFSRNEIILWCQLVRAAGAPLDTSEKNLWREYRKLARSLRRKWR